MEKKQRISDKNKYIISIILVIAAVIVVAIAVAMNNVKPPETETVPAVSENSDVIQDEGAISYSEAERRDGMFTMLIVGRDAVGSNTDTIMLASFDVEANKMNIMSIPRDTIVNVRRATKKINAAYATAGGDIYALYDEVESITGVRPDKYVIVTVDGFVELIDAIGGVEIDVPIDMVYEDPVQDLTINIKKGYQTLDGYDAMGFMRYRKTYVEGDIGRIKVQHTFIDALMKKMLTPETLVKIPELAEIVLKNVETDLTLGNEIWLGKQILEMDRSNDIKMHTLPGYADYYDGLSYYFPDEAEVVTLVNECYNPYTTPIEELNLFKK